MFFANSLFLGIIPMKIFNPLYLLSLPASGFNRPISNRELSQRSALSASPNQNSFVFARQYPQCDFSLATVPPYPQCDARPTQAKNVNALLMPTERYSGEPSWYGTLDTVIERIDSAMTAAEKSADQATRALFMGAGIFVLLRMLASKLGLIPSHNQGQAAAIGQVGAHAPVAHERARG